MKNKTPKWLEDVRNACAFIIGAAEGKTLADYTSDIMLRSAIERNFEIIGEAVGRIARFDPDTASRIGNYQRIISFRNVLIHGYELVEHERVWEVITESLPLLYDQVNSLVSEAQAD